MKRCDMRIGLFLIIMFPVFVQGQDLFMTIHCDPPYPHLFNRLFEIVQLANAKQIPLTIEMTPQWADSVLADTAKMGLIRQWQAQGHEIGAHHHAPEFGWNWDGFTFRDTSTIQHSYLYRGDMNDYMELLNQIGGDSLMLTCAMSGDGSDWPDGLIYRTDGGQEVEDFISRPYADTLNGHPVTVITHKLINTTLMVDSLEKIFLSTSLQGVSGTVTHVNDFDSNQQYLLKWFDFLNGKSVKTVRQIMRERGYTISTKNHRSVTQPKEYLLVQNYPNPFNPKTVISIQLSVFGQVEIFIYNSLGQRVKKLFDGHLEQGQHQFIWDGRNDSNHLVGSGVYICRLQSGRVIHQRKMILVR